MEGGKLIMRSFARFLKNDDAATAVEYSVVLAMILLVTISAIGMVGSKTSGLWSSIVSGIRAMGM
jgi:Flp pilus assembly pilin Flp